MSVVNLYNGIYRVLANDEQILNYLGLSSASTNLEKAKHIQKRSKPQDLVENLPLITFYSPGGFRDSINDYVYGSRFFFDIYTSDDVELAQNIAQRILDLFEGEIPPWMGVENFTCRFEDGHESAVDLANIYCFTIEVTMFISLAK